MSLARLLMEQVLIFLMVTQAERFQTSCLSIYTDVIRKHLITQPKTLQWRKVIYQVVTEASNALPHEEKKNATAW